MSGQFWQALGAVLGLIIGAPGLYALVRVSVSYGGLLTDVKTAKETGERTEKGVADLSSRMQTVEQTLHGPDGTNGLYSDVRDIKAQLGTRPRPAVA